jgi:hypothetical protein
MSDTTLANLTHPFVSIGHYIERCPPENDLIGAFPGLTPPPDRAETLDADRLPGSNSGLP